MNKEVYNFFAGSVVCDSVSRLLSEIHRNRNISEMLSLASCGPIQSRGFAIADMKS